MDIKPPSGIFSITPVTPGGKPVEQSQEAHSQKPTQAAEPTAPAVNPQAVSDALKKYADLRKKLKQAPLLSGAAGLFTEGVVFPPELLDPKDPTNDPKYLHLIFAVFGLKELERSFASEEQQQEMKEEEEGDKKEKKKNGSNSVRKKRNS